MANLTPQEYVKAYRQTGSKNGAARLLNKDPRNLRRFVERNQTEIKSLLNMETFMEPNLISVKEVDTETDLHTQVVTILKKKARTLPELEEQLKTSPRIILAIIEDLKEQGYLIEEIGGSYKVGKTVPPQENEYNEQWEGERLIRFGVVSDNHLCSKYQQLTFLKKLYDIFESEGLKTVYNPGDLCEGFRMRPGHEHEIFVHGADDQEKYIIDNYPYKRGIQTKFILGNHDTSHIKNGGHNIGIPIAKAREDMEYLGIYNAKVNITPNCSVELNHPLDGATYALSYSCQKYIDSLSGGEKPNILLNGHHHKVFYMFYRNIHAFECGATQAQSPWMKGKRIAAHVGGWIIEVHVDKDGTITRCKGEFIPCYVSLKEDY